MSSYHLIYSWDLSFSVSNSSFNSWIFISLLFNLLFRLLISLLYWYSSASYLSKFESNSSFSWVNWVFNSTSSWIRKVRLSIYSLNPHNVASCAASPSLQRILSTSNNLSLVSFNSVSRLLFVLPISSSCDSQNFLLSFSVLISPFPQTKKIQTNPNHYYTSWY